MAAITASSGSVTPDRYGIRPTTVASYDTSTRQYFAFGGITRKSPRSWRDTDRLNTEGFDVDAKLLIFDDTTEGGPTVGASWYADVAVNDFGRKDKFTFSVSSPGGGTVAAWQDDEQTDEAISGESFRYNGTISNWNDPESSVRGAKAACGFVRVAATPTDTVSLEARGITFDYQNANESRFTGGDDAFEITGVHPVSAGSYDWTPFDENESNSAFVMMSIVCGNTNRYARETRPAWTVPLFDNNSTGLT